MTDYNSVFTYYPTNHTRILSDENFITALRQSIRIKLGRALTKDERSIALNILRSLNPATLNKPPKKLIEDLTKIIVNEIVKKPCKNEESIDIHEMLKNEIGISTDNTAGYNEIKSQKDFTEQIANTFANQVNISSIFNLKSINDLQKAFNPNLVKSYVTITLDSRYRLLSNGGTTSFQWIFINNENSQQGSVNAIGNIRDITAMRVFPIRLPYSNDGDNQYNRVTMFIQEFSAQSIIAQENRRYHFLFKPYVKGRWIELDTDKMNDGYFRFRNPITRLDTFTLSFGTPLEIMTFDTDRTTAIIPSGGYSTTTKFTTSIPHNLETGDLVIISGFTTDNNSTDINAISTMNRSKGHIITYIDTTNFTVDVDTSNISVNGVGNVSAINGSAIITGVGTSFNTFFNIGDSIEISSVKYSIQSIQSGTQLTLTTPYTGLTAGGLTYKRNNIVSDLSISVYFASKRFFVTLELEYYASDEK